MAFRFYKQPDAMDCGPTCLRMVSKHYGKNISLQTLREKTQIGKEGVNLVPEPGPIIKIKIFIYEKIWAEARVKKNKAKLSDAWLTHALQDKFM